MNKPKFSIRWKLLGSFAGLALLVLVVVLFAVSTIIDDRIRENINTNFREAGKIFEQLQDVRFRQLHQTATLVAAMPYMKAAISTGDVNTVNSQIKQELVHLLHFDPIITDSLTAGPAPSGTDSVGLVMVFDRRGIPLGQLSGAPLPTRPMTDRAGLRAALDGRNPRQSYIWKQRGQYYNVITIPVFLRGQVIAALSLGYPIRNVEAEQLARLIEYEVSYLVDNRLWATSIESLSEQDRQGLVRDIQNTLFTERDLREGTTTELELDDDRWLVYVLPMVESNPDGAGITGYYTVAQSLTQALVPLRELQRVIFLIGLGGILLAGILAISLTNNLTRPINLLLDGIKRIENDRYDQPVEVVSRDEFGQLTRTFNALVANIRENLREKETLLAEIHHRVKNNLAVISGLLQLESSNAADPHTERILKNSQLRIHSMATVHEMLYQAPDFNRLSFDDFAARMVASIEAVYAGTSDAATDLEIDDVHLNVNQAVPCGLIINELVTNAFKHAYPGNRSGPIRVIIRDEGPNMFLRVTDRGVGLPDDFTLGQSESLGFILIRILAKQLDADIQIDGEGGTDVTIVFQKEDTKGASSSLELS